jgi:hypothetical protein
MHKRTTPKDVQLEDGADDLEALVQDKREGWRASGAKARRRQRRYKNLLTQHLVKLGGATPSIDSETDNEPLV